MDQHKTTAVDTSVTCPHTYKRVTRETSHLYKIGAGGYFQVGVFDTTVTCRDCREELYTVKKDAPLCQSCLLPLIQVNEQNGVATCGDFHTDSILFGKNLTDEKQHQVQRLTRVQEWCDAREEEADRLAENAGTLDWEHAVHKSMMRIFRKGSIKQIWPYTCTNQTCDWQGRLIWLHTPGD